jgi:CheY-like chemotaxis protein
MDWEIAIEEGTSDAVDLVEELGLGTAAGNPLTYVLTRGETQVRIGAAGEPVETEARWLVSTSAITLAGVVSIDNTECLILKPDVLATSSGRVAIVDDSEIVREIVGFSLKPYGIEVDPFDDPGPLVGTLAVKPVDLVLLDLSFKGLDVPGLIQRIKAALPGVQVYLHSDRNAIELARLAESSGADGHLAKALGRDQFVSRVLRILRSRRSS